MLHLHILSKAVSVCLRLKWQNLPAAVYHLLTTIYFSIMAPANSCCSVKGPASQLVLQSVATALHHNAANAPSNYAFGAITVNKTKEIMS